MRVDFPHRAAELGCERPRGGFGGRPDELELDPDRARAALDLGQPGRTMKVAWPWTQHRRSRHSPSFVHRGGTSTPWRVFPTRGDPTLSAPAPGPPWSASRQARTAS